MKFLIIFALILSVSSLGFAAQVVGYFRDPDFPGKCVYESLLLSSGEKAELPYDCGQFRCGEDSFGRIYTCGVYAPPPGCVFTDYIHSTAPYPKCCEKKLDCSFFKISGNTQV